MEKLRIDAETFKDEFLDKMRLPLWSVAASVLVGVAAYYVMTRTGYSIYFLIALIGAGFIPLFIRYPRTWIYVSFLLMPAFLTTSDEGFSALDAVFGILYNVMLFVWILWSVLVARRKIIRNWGDALLAIFFLLVPLNAVPAYLNGIEMFYWFREPMMMSLVLFYLPIREYFTEKKHLRTLVVFIFFPILLAAIYDFYAYYEASQNMMYAFQLGRTVRINLVILTFGSVGGLIFLLLGKMRKLNLWIAPVTVAASAAIVLTMARTFWVLIAIGIVLLQFYLSAKQRTTALIIVLVSGIALVGATYYILGDNYRFVLKLFDRKVQSLTMGSSDISLATRFDEYEQHIKNIKESPLAGKGFAVKNKYFNIIQRSTVNSTVSHNSYLALASRAGIPMTLFFFGAVFYFIIKSFKLSLITKDGLMQSAALSALFAGIVIVLSNLTSFQIVSRDGTIVTAIMIAFVSIVEENYKKYPEFRKENKLLKLWRPETK